MATINVERPGDLTRTRIQLNPGAFGLDLRGATSLVAARGLS
jgi:hypothetical protein